MDEKLTVRRAPKYGVFLALGAALGILAAMILTFSFSGTFDESPNTGLVYDQGQVFGFLLLICIPVGLAVAGGIALVPHRRASHPIGARRSHGRSRRRIGDCPGVGAGREWGHEPREARPHPRRRRTRTRRP